MEKGYQDLDVWKKSMELVVDVYQLTENYPADERFGFVAQMRRCAVSIPSNIAEGYRRVKPKDFARFVTIAYGSGAELETQLELSRRLGFILGGNAVLEQRLNDVMSMLNGLRRSLIDVPDVRRTTAV